MARQFRFRLETLERVRRLTRDVQRRAVAAQVRELATSDAAVRRLTDAVRHTGGELRQAQGSTRLDVTAIRERHAYQGWLRRCMARAIAERSTRQADLRAAQTQLSEASKRLRVIEKLRERRWFRYVADVQREEQAITDEAALNRYIRSSSESIQAWSA